MSYTFKKSQEEILTGIGTIGLKQSEFVALVQDLAVCSAEHGIMERNGTLLEKVLAEVHGRFHTCIREWLTREGVPFTVKDGKVKFAWAKAKAIALAAGHTDWTPDTDKPSDADLAILAKVCQRALGRLEGVVWNEKIKQAGSEARAANKADPEKIRKRMTSALKDAEEAGVDVSDLLPSPELDENLAKIAKMLAPFGDNKEALAVVMVAIGTALGDLNKAKAA